MHLSSRIQLNYTKLKEKYDERTSKISNELPKKFLTLTIKPSSTIRISSIKKINTILNSHVKHLL